MNLTDISIVCNGRIRTSKKGVKHAVVSVGSITYSIMWFRRTNMFRVFWPYPSNVQEHIDFDTPGKVVEFIAKLQEAAK